MLSLEGKYPAAILNALEDALRAPNRIMRPRVCIYDGLSGALKVEINELISGSVTVDTNTSPSKKLEIEFYRPKTLFGIHDIWLTDLYQAFYEIYVPLLNTAAYDYQDGGFIPIPVFAGLLVPGSIKKSGIDASIVEISAFGFEQRYMYPLGTIQTITKGTKHSDAIKGVIDYYDAICGYTWPNPGDTGDHTYVIQSSISRLVEDLKYGSTTIQNDTSTSSTKKDEIGNPETPWDTVKKLALGCGKWNVYFDNNFRLQVHEPSRAAVRVFSESEANILKLPEEEVALKEFVNRVKVYGATPESPDSGGPAGPQITGQADAEGSYRPSMMKWIMLKEITESTVSTKEAADTLAKETLKEVVNVEMAVTLDTVTEPRLSEGDKIQIENPDGGVYTIPALTYTIPLTPSNAQTITSSKKKNFHRLLNIISKPKKTK